MPRRRIRQAKFAPGRLADVPNHSRPTTSRPSLPPQAAPRALEASGRILNPHPATEVKAPPLVDPVRTRQVMPTAKRYTGS